MILTAHELTVLAVSTAVTVIALVFVAAACAWRQERDIRRQDGDIDKLWTWCSAAAEALGWTDDDGPGGGGEPDAPPPDDPDPTGGEPDTAISHPADLYARKAAVLARYTHTGQHRS